MLTQVKFCYKMAAPARLQLPVDGLPPWLKLAVIVRGVPFQKQTVDQSQHTGPANQSEHTALCERRCFIATGNKKKVTNRLARDCEICEK